MKNLPNITAALMLNKCKDYSDTCPISELDYLQKIAKLMALKNEKWGDETIKAWLSMMQEKGWDEHKFHERCLAVADMETYGRMSWNVWVNAPEIVNEKYFADKKIQEREEREAGERISVNSDVVAREIKECIKILSAKSESIKRIKFLSPSDKDWGEVRIEKTHEKFITHFSPTEKFKRLIS